MKESWDLADDFWGQHMSLIEELIEQAYEIKPYLVADPVSFEIVQKIGYDSQPMNYKSFNKEKFAELIVLECIKEIKGLKNTTADDMISKGYGCWDSYSGAVDDSIGRLVQHFGIEDNAVRK